MIVFPLLRKKLILISFALFTYNVTIAQDLFELAKDATAQKNYDIAIKYYNKLINVDPSEPVYYLNRAECFLNISDYKMAINDLKHVLSEEVEPYNKKAILAIGFCYLKLKQYKNAISYFTSITKDIDSTIDNISKDTILLSSINYQVKCYMEEKRYDTAQLFVDNILLKYNNKLINNENLLYEKAYILYRRGLSKEALEYCESILRKNPNFMRATSLREKLLQFQEVKDAKIWAVFVGVGVYESKNMDVIELVKSQIDTIQGMWKKLNANVSLLVNQNATRVNIIDALNIFKDTTKVSPNDMILFYFIGHGNINNDEFGICPNDYFKDNPSTFILETEIKQIIEASPAKHKVCIMDACKSKTQGIRNTNNLSHFEIKRRSIPKSSAFLYSTQMGKDAIYKRNSGAEFSHYLLKCLYYKESLKLNNMEDLFVDANDDKIVTINELYNYIKEGLKKTTDNQIPQIILNNNIDIPLMILTEEK